MDICGYVLSNALLNPGLLCAVCARFEPGKLPIGCGLARSRGVTDIMMPLRAFYTRYAT
jgi:hypothetical protein